MRAQHFGRDGARGSLRLGGAERRGGGADPQLLYQGTWYTTASQYFPAGTNGRSAVQLGASGEAGIKARVRSVYVDGTSGGNVNSTACGSWKYRYFSNWYVSGRPIPGRLGRLGGNVLRVSSVRGSRKFNNQLNWPHKEVLTCLQ